MRIEERRAGPRKPSLKTKVLRETVHVQHNSDVHELARRLEKYDSTGSRHFAQIAQVDAEAAAAYGNYPEPANDGILRWESQRKRRFDKKMNLDLLRLKCWNGAWMMTEGDQQKEVEMDN
ncbi:hypothetical protein M514_17866 [Trichuris suis]|uniref:Uncharacterized protein n=1 Tax=Trichuris suis TaxID=68888 RepID=A0A085NKL1_9BILA|nr:hypothetical protein M514_17866 [Trichuris suis]